MLAAAATASLTGRARAGDEDPQQQSSTDEAQRLHIEAHRLYDADEYQSSAETFAELLDIFPESNENRVVRENALLNTLQSALDAHSRAASLAPDANPEAPLRFAEKILVDYRSSFSDAYGSDAKVSSAVDEVGSELDTALEPFELPPWRARDEGTMEDSLHEAMRIYDEGQRLYEAERSEDAVRAWAGMFAVLPEEEATKELRESLLVHVIEVAISAPGRSDASGSVDGEETLDFAVQILTAYNVRYAQAYGDGAELPAPVKELAAKLREARESLVRPPSRPPTQGYCLSPCLSACLSQIPPPRGCRGDNDGLGMLGLLVAPVLARRRSEVLRSIAERLPADVVQRLRDRSTDDD